MAERYQKWLDQNARQMTGEHVIITGGNSGIGYAAAGEFLALGASVTLACRNPARAAFACERLRSRYPRAAVDYEVVDLASFSSIDAFAARLSAQESRIHVFLHCAGVYYPRTSVTEDGLPMTVGVNYTGTVRLSEAVEPLLVPGGRMIFVTSLVDRNGRVSREPKKEGYAAYAKSKTLLSAYVLHRARTRTEGMPLFIAVHPGITATDILSSEKTAHKPLFSRLGHAFLYRFTHSPEKAALTAIRAAVGDGENGDIIAPRGPFGISGYPHKTRFCARVRRLERTM